MSTFAEEYIKTLIEKAACTHNLKTWRYTLDKLETIGQNYFAIIVPVVLSGKCNDEEVNIQLVLKLAPTNERYRISGAVTLMFAREIFVYDNLFEIYNKIQENFPVHLKYIIPQTYYLRKDYCKEVLVMQNMLQEGFKPYVDRLFLDFGHIIVSLKSLAQLHALSFIMKNKYPELFKEACDVCVPMTEGSNKRFIDILTDRLNKAIIKFENTEYVSLLQIFKKDIAIIFESVVTEAKNTCICHGDIWKENVLYKYEDSKPTSACVIDFQTARLSSPAFDILYIILCSTDTELRKNHYYTLLDVYYETFKDVLKEGGLESQQIYSRLMFDHDLKVVAPACTITANCALWLASGLQEEGHVRSKIVFSTLDEKSQAVNKYRQSIKSIIDDCCNYRYMNLQCDNHVA